MTIRRTIGVLLGTAAILALVYSFHDSIYGMYHSKSHIAIHAVLEMFSVFVSFTISLYGWIVYQETRTRLFFWVPIVFIAVGWLDLLHAFTFPGMPYFIRESAIELTAWFWITARLTEAGALFLLLSIPDGKMESRRGTVFLLLPHGYVVAAAWFIFQLQHLLPVLVVEGIGPTPLKNGLEYAGVVLHTAACFIIVRKYRRTRETGELDMLLAFLFLIASSFVLTIYKTAVDFDAMLGHVLKVAGYVYLLKGLYFSQIRIVLRDKEEAQTGLKRAESLIGSLCANTPDSITLLDTQFRIRYVNEGFYNVYGWKPEEVVGRKYQELMPDYTEEIERVRSQLLNGESLVGIEVIRQRKDSTRIPVNTTIFPIRDEQGEIMHIGAITRDITEREAVFNRIRDAELELKRTIRHQFGITFRYSKQDDRFVHTLCDGKLLYEMGLIPEDIIGKDLRELPFYSAEFEPLVEAYEEAWQGKSRVLECKFPKFYCLIALNPNVRDGRIFEVIGSCIDISNVKSTEEMLQRAEKLAVVGELAAGVAHEIRNPLTTLKGFTQLLSERMPDADKPFVELMLSELDRIEGITNEFMIVAKPQAMRREPVDVRQLLEQVIAFMHPEALLNGIEIGKHDDGGEAVISCDGNQLKQVFLNVIKNALDAMTAGGRLQIALRRQNEQQLCVRISDTGCGMPEEVVSRLGEPFYTLKGKGTGLGLMVSLRIIEAHQGVVTFRSKVGEGTTVEMLLPYGL